MTKNESASAVNRLLTSLPRNQRQRLVGDCIEVALAGMETLVETGRRLRHVRFPVSATIPLTMPVHGRYGVEVGRVGEEGMLGASLALGIDPSPVRALVRGAGRALYARTMN